MKGDMVKTEIVEQQVEPRSSHGIDHEGEGKVLIRHGDRRLVWRKPRSSWAGRFTDRNYCPAELQVILPKVTEEESRGAWDGRLKMLHRGGRLSVRLMMDHYGEILRLLDLTGKDLPMSLLQHTKRTVVVSENLT